MNNKPNEWEQLFIDNAVEYSIMEWRPLVVNLYTKNLYAETSKNHVLLLHMRLIKMWGYANMNITDL